MTLLDDPALVLLPDLILLLLFLSTLSSLISRSFLTALNFAFLRLFLLLLSATFVLRTCSL